MKTLLLFSIVLINFSVLFSQEQRTRVINLIPNHSFEELRNLPLKRTRRPMTRWEPTSGYIPFRSNLNYWFKGTQTTPDLRITTYSLYLDCSQRYDDCDRSRTGLKMVGLMTWLKNRYMDDYREYLQVRLKKPLEPNKKTFISLWVCKERGANLVSNNIGLFFSIKKIFKDTEGAFDLVPHLNCDTIINKNKKEWVEIKKEFIPEKPFKYVTIGNFLGNEKTDTMTFENYTASPFNPTYAYYLIDDVRIWQEVDTVDTYSLDDITIEPEKPFELHSILFEFNKAVLDTSSFATLNKLSAFLKENPLFKLNIHGHTDSKGSQDFNMNLSKERAKAVLDFLIKTGIEENRLSFKGFGEEEPISENDDENRRVEFVIVE